MALDPDLQMIEDKLLPDHRKWGWVVFRATYGNDEQWAQCNTAFQRLVREVPLMQQGGEAHLAKHVDFPVRDDEATFKNATSAALRSYFNEWRRSDEAFAEQGLDKSKRAELWYSNRYRYFIRIDAESMQSILDEANDVKTGAWVDLIQVDWPDSESDAEDEDFESAALGFMDGFPPIEGMTTYELGFQRVPVTSLYPVCWGDKDTIPEKFYTRPPKITYRF